MDNIPFTKSQGNVNVLEKLHLLNKKQRHAVLATVSEKQPYTSLVAFVLTPDLKDLIFATPKKTNKYRNILKNKKVSLMIDNRTNTSQGYMDSEAITVMGSASPVRKGRKRDIYAKIYSEKHPELSYFINAPSTALILVTLDTIIHAGKFQSVTSWHTEKA